MSDSKKEKKKRKKKRSPKHKCGTCGEQFPCTSRMAMKKDDKLHYICDCWSVIHGVKTRADEDFTHTETFYCSTECFDADNPEATSSDDSLRGELPRRVENND